MHAQEYTIEVIQNAVGIESTFATGINNNGVVVGTCWKPNFGLRAFKYENGIMNVINFSGSTYYHPLSISDNDNYVGTVDLPNFVTKGFFNSEFLPTLGSDDSWASDINNSDQILGTTSDTQIRYLVIYENGQIIHSYQFPDGSTEAINDSGFATGTDFPGGSFGRAYIYNYEENQFDYLPVIGVETFEAFDINNLNQIVGYFYDTDSTVAGFIWEDNNYTFLPTKSVANAINDSGVVVGGYRPINFPPAHAFVYDHVNGFRDLNDLIPVGTGWELQDASDINELGQIVGSGTLNGVSQSYILTPNKLVVTKPTAGELFIAGEVDTIKWIGGGNIDSVKITAVLNWNTPVQSEIVLVESLPGDAESFIWTIPDTLLSYQTRINIENVLNPNEISASDKFRTKPYVLTRVNSDSTYYAYEKNRDQWGFSNSQGDMWPPTWWQQFVYSGVDPFTGRQYSQWLADSAFKSIASYKFPDWVSWVNTFSVNACYFTTFFGIYRSAAVIAWKSKVANWNGSCFGIAVSNALAFSYRSQFGNKYPNYPVFINPITVASNTEVKRVVNELFTHQLGNPHQTIRATIGLLKTPKQTLIDLMELFKEDNAQIRTLSFLNNPPGSGGHAILAYGLDKDPINQSIFYVKVYDNAYPNSTYRITIDTSTNFNNGSWINPFYLTWGGNKWIYLRNPTIDYLTNPTMAKTGTQQSPFILDESELQVFSTLSASIKIQDNLGNTTGFYDNFIQLNIPGSVPFVVENGSETPPYGYSLLTDTYSVVLDNFLQDTVETFFFTGNKSFVYGRNEATQIQTDRLFFDGGVSATNPDAELKTVELLNLINETTQEKLTVVRSIELAQNDSVKIENPDSNTVKLISYGTAKDYDIEINYLTETGFGRFGDSNISLEANTSHIFVPNWTDLTISQLTVLVDIGNDGTIDDTLHINNTVSVEDQGYFGLPKEYNLAQNYPNPFNPTTTIQYSIPHRSNVELKVYDVLGNEVAILINEEKERGVYTVSFDATGLASGMYLYRLQAGNFVETKKMILLR